MARKHVHPALYEIIRSREERTTVGVPAGPAAPAGAGEPVPVQSSNLLRVPVGFVWLGGAGVLLALVAAYMTGYSLGERAEGKRRAQLLEDRLAAQLDQGLVADPLAGADGMPPLIDPAPPPAPDDARRGGASGGAATPGGGAPARVATTDPRVAGHYYFVLAHPDPERAPELVTFLRSNGLDAHVVPDHNGTLRKVIVLPGYASPAERSSEAIKQLEARIRTVGLKWKSVARGNTDLGDYFPEPYRPSTGNRGSS